MTQRDDSKPASPTSASALASAASLPADATALKQHLEAISRERDRAYQALAMREADLARVQRIAGVGGVEVDLRDGFKTTRSPEYLAIHGLPPDAAHETHRDWVNRIHPEDRERTERHFLDAIKGADSEYAAEYRIVRPDNGQVRWVSVRARIERDAQGRATRLIGAHFDITDRKLAEQSLRESEARFRAIANSAPVPMWVTNLDGTRAFVNQAYLDFFAITPEQAVTHNWRDAIHPDDLPRVLREQDIPRVIAEHKANPDVQKPFALEMRMRDRSGEWRWVHSESLPRFDVNGEHIGFIGIGYDVTKAKLAEAELRESEERFRQITNSAPVPMWVTKLDRTRGFVNRAYMDFLGLSFEDSCLFDWRKVIHPGDLPRILQEQIAGESSLRPFVLEARYKRADGEWRWLRSQSQPRFDPHGNHLGFVGIAHDVTLAKQAEAELRQMNETLEQRIKERTAQLAAREAQLRSIFETSHMYQGLLDGQGRVVYANKTALAGIRADAADVLGKPFWQTPWFTATPDMPHAVQGAFARVLQGEAVRIEMQLLLPAGERMFDFAMRPIFDQYGAITGAVPEAVDITERKQGEEALRQSQKMEAVGQLTGGVAHDFNNLLTIIRSATDFLRRRELPEERRRRYIDAISDTVDRASKLTGQLLAFARRQPLKPQIFSVSNQIESIAQLIRPVVGSGIQITLDVGGPDAGFFALADVAQFETAIINLAVNARDAMPEGGELLIKVGRVDGVPPLRGQPRRAGAFITVSMTDTGTGIPSDKLEMIFEPFFTTKEVGKGTGLGLSQAFGFAKQSGGDITVRSAPAAGATFTLYLPQAEMPQDAAGVEAAAADAVHSGRGHRVLVVEDNEDIGRFSTDLLQDLGYKISWVTNATDALTALSRDEFAFDLVFSDIIMPGMNGVELATAIRERFPGLPVVLTSGYSNVLAENAHSGFELIQKPYSVEALSRTLRRAIGERRPAAG
jgi:PAS domain S-box-containing protein